MPNSPCPSLQHSNTSFLHGFILVWHFRQPWYLAVVLLEFTKMNGAGNDFVLLDNRAQKIKLTRDRIVRLCDRHRGVGADGILILVPSRTGKADWAWDFYNSDGSIGEMCGNGARCFARFVQKTVGLNGGFKFETEAGIITARLEGERVTVNLTKPHGLKLGERVKLSTGETIIHSLDTGVSASAMISARVHNFASPVKVQVQGGDTLEVSFQECDGAFEDVRLTGPAEFVFEGRVKI